MKASGQKWQEGIGVALTIDLDRGTLGSWVGRACFHLMPVINHTLERIDRKIGN